MNGSVYIFKNLCPEVGYNAFKYYVGEIVVFTKSRYKGENFKDVEKEYTDMESQHYLSCNYYEIMNEFYQEGKHKVGITNFIDETRIKELENISNKSFDLTRVLEICKEINIAYNNNSYLSIAMLLRSFVDHIPPIFGEKNFKTLVNNYRFPLSIKKFR